MVWQGFSKRKFPRVKYDSNIFVSFSDLEKNNIFVKNIGTGGICVISEKQLQLFDSIKLNIKLLDFKDDIICNAKVMWSISTINREKKAYDIGLEFVDLKKHDKNKIEYLIDITAE